MGSGGFGMTISLLMGDRRRKRDVWRGLRRNGPHRGNGVSDRPRSGPDDPEKDEMPPEWRDPSKMTPENDLALARMMGCAFLFGLACIVGLLIRIF